ncbi:MAG TPA: metal ABC transporter permease [Gammaproteobacteria bacterium]|nr:metal ABC transporter permease [Gammaproteobacteria bacterium]
MSEFIQALFQYQFLQTALGAGLLASVGCGVMGPYVVVKRIAFLAGGIAHSVLGGMGVALYFGADPLAGALVAAVLAAVLIGWVRLNWRTGEDTLIGALWAIGMAIGILFISRIPGYQADLVGYLFGNILLVPQRELWFMAGLDALLVAVVVLWHRQILAVVFDEEQARLRGLPVTFFYLLLLVLIALTVVLLIHVVGLILVLALLTLPAAIAAQHVHSLARMMVIATVLSALLVTLGLAMSYAPNLPPGPSIVLLAGLAYLISSLLARRRSP